MTTLWHCNNDLTDSIVPYRLVVRVFTTFTINNCNRDLVSLSDGMKRIEICGQKQGEEVLFETSQSQLTIHYKSTSDNDLVSMVISRR